MLTEPEAEQTSAYFVPFDTLLSLLSHDLVDLFWEFHLIATVVKS
jgi:hypothetical protein